MPTRNTRFFPYILSCLLFLLSLTSCDALPAALNAGTSTPTSSEPPLNVWAKAANGIEIRTEDWKSEGNNEDRVTILRLDPQHIHLSIGYQPRFPVSLNEWMKQTHALAVINGGYFDDKNQPTGLLIANGQAHGSSYQGFGGMLAVNAQGHLELRSLLDQPYDPDNEQIQQATQSSPMLVLNGQRTDFKANAASERRTVVAQDKQGRFLLIVSPKEAFSLDELADLLVSSDLSIQKALNLDGGASTGMYLRTGNQNVTIDSVTTLPIVIIIK
jgi:exopolysaccharide biosynthesis protein